MSRKVLITGSEGTLGSKLREELIDRGYNVHGLDLQHTDTPNTYRADISEYRQVERVFDKIKPDVCYALAAEFGRNNGQEYHEQLWKHNAIGTQNVIDACTKYGTHLVFASSSEAYGDTAEDGKPLEEDILLVQVPNFHNNYALSKWTNEKQIQIAQKNTSLKATILRFFNAYGPGEYYNDYRSVVCLFIYRLLHDCPITVYKDYHRVFMFVNDWSRTVANVVDRIPSIMSISAEQRVFNIGGTEYVTVEEMLNKLQRLIPESKSTISILPKEQANITNKRPDNSRAKVWLDHRCLTNLDQGLPITVNWMRKTYGKDTPRS
jgi:dTDP-glucose 4,6-dehydratase